MEIGEALKRLLGNDVNFGYGNETELVKHLKEKVGTKFPLVWHPIVPFTEDYATDYKSVNNANLLIFVNTEAEWFNGKRFDNSYLDYIIPTWETVKRIIQLNPYISVVGDLEAKYTITDQPFYEVNNTSYKVDTRIIELNLRIKTNCI